MKIPISKFDKKYLFDISVFAYALNLYHKVIDKY